MIMKTNMKLEAFFVDFDDTLDGFHEPVRNAMEQLRNRNLRINALATSRSVWEPVVYELADYYRFTNLILENGNIVLCRVDNQWMDDSRWAGKYFRYWEIFEEAAGKILKTVNIIETSSLSHVNRERTFHTLGIPGADAPVYLELKSRTVDLKSACHDSLSRAADMVRTSITEFQIPVHEVRCPECITFGFADKADAVSFLAGHGSDRPFTSAAMGNGLNDLEMLGIVDIPCCSANSHRLVKKTVGIRNGIVASSPSYEGVAEALNLLASVYENQKMEYKKL